MKEPTEYTWTPKTVLAISAHADDIELGAGGTIHKWIAEGATVVSMIFSTLKKRDVRLPEINEAARQLGIEKNDITILDYPNRLFSNFRQDILQNMIDMGATVQPEVVLVPTTTDCHQDHQVIVAEAQRAFKRTTILGYEAPWNMTHAHLQATVLLSGEDIKAKQKAVTAHKHEEYRPYIDADFVMALATIRGFVAGGQYGESYEVIRWIM